MKFVVPIFVMLVMSTGLKTWKDVHEDSTTNPIVDVVLKNKDATGVKAEEIMYVRNEEQETTLNNISMVMQ